MQWRTRRRARSSRGVGDALRWAPPVVLAVVLGFLSLGTVGSEAFATIASPFVSSVARVNAAQLGRTWHQGCPVPPSQLRQLHLSYVGFDGRTHVGTMVVNASVTTSVVRVFALLYARRFPIHSMVPESRFAGSDPASMAADNTSGFNCRFAVAPGTPQWSVHAYGEAIDVNPVQNPYVFNGVAQPVAGAAFINRSDDRAGMAIRGGVLVNAFASVGWYWGGRWSASPDYQHFSSTGG